jgi:hypothetical protein
MSEACGTYGGEEKTEVVLVMKAEEKKTFWKT